MRETVVKCDECGIVIDYPITIDLMLITKHKVSTTIVGESNIKPDFCGVPCLLKWLNNKLTGGT